MYVCVFSVQRLLSRSGPREGAQDVLSYWRSTVYYIDTGCSGVAHKTPKRNENPSALSAPP